MIRHLFSIVALALLITIPALAQEDDIDAAMKKAMENANKPASKADMKKLEQQAKAQMDQWKRKTKLRKRNRKPRPRRWSTRKVRRHFRIGHRRSRNSRRPGCPRASSLMANQK